jgi:hypothetical protein
MGVGERGGMAQTMYTHVNKCIKKGKKKRTLQQILLKFKGLSKNVLQTYITTN